MIFDMKKAKPLIEQFQAAHETEGVAIKNLLTYMQDGGRDNKILEDLTNHMTSMHDKKMDIFNQLQSLRLDK